AAPAVTHSTRWRGRLDGDADALSMAAQVSAVVAAPSAARITVEGAGAEATGVEIFIRAPSFYATCARPRPISAHARVARGGVCRRDCVGRVARGRARAGARGGDPGGAGGGAGSRGGARGGVGGEWV